MKWHENAVAPDCMRAIARIAAAGAARDFYLAGGTALALRLGHRVSVDLDFFSPEIPLNASDRHRLAEEISKSGPVRIDDEKDRTIHMRVGRAHVSFFYFAAPLLHPSGRWNGVEIASAMDIGAMKLSALVGRGSRKDFLDLYFLTTLVAPLKYVLRQAQKKFPRTADFTAQALRALVYFKDAETEDLPRMLTAVSWKDVKTHFEKEVRAISRAFLN